MPLVLTHWPRRQTSPQSNLYTGNGDIESSWLAPTDQNSPEIRLLNTCAAPELRSSLLLATMRHDRPSELTFLFPAQRRRSPTRNVRWRYLSLP
jgi:hypothetical protein